MYVQNSTSQLVDGVLYWVRLVAYPSDTNTFLLTSYCALKSISRSPFQMKNLHNFRVLLFSLSTSFLNKEGSNDTFS